MIGSKLLRATFAAALISAIPAAAAAQGEPSEPTAPEGVEWHLVWYADGDDLAAVPWSVDATLLLQDGAASGSTGCNSLSGTYTIDGEALTFGEAFSVTRMACPEDEMAVEAGYLAALPGTVSWSVDDSLVGEDAALDLYDADGDSVLVFTLPVMELTQADVVALRGLIDRQQRQIERLDERLDNVRIGKLRDRIENLENQVKRLRAQGSSSGPDTSAFDAAEKVLLKGVRADIARTCEPRRTQNPAGTVAAIQCRPETDAVRDMAYYLMESDPAAKVFEKRMKDAGVKSGTMRRSCAFGNPSRMVWVGGGVVEAGCYRNEEGRANLRFVHMATECKTLKAGGTQMKEPHVYIAVLGPDRDIAGLWQWAASSTDWEAGEDLFDWISQPGQKGSRMCPS